MFVRAVLNNAYHRDHLQVVVFRSDSVLIISDEMSKSNFARIIIIKQYLLTRTFIAHVCGAAMGYRALIVHPAPLKVKTLDLSVYISRC